MTLGDQVRHEHNFAQKDIQKPECNAMCFNSFLFQGRGSNLSQSVNTIDDVFIFKW